jgi:hypothetical protein
VSQNDQKAFADVDSLGAQSIGQQSEVLTRRNVVPSRVQIMLVDRRGKTIFDQSFSRQQE